MNEQKTPQLVHCAACGHSWVVAYLPMDAGDVAALFKAARCPACAAGKKNILMGGKPQATESGNAERWLHNHDTGTSSLTIWRTLMGETPDRADIPYDPSDFGRCYRLLKVMPEWRGRLGEVAVRYPVWTPFVEVWDELTALFEEESPSGKCPNLYARMKELRPKPVLPARPSGGA